MPTLPATLVPLLLTAIVRIAGAVAVAVAARPLIATAARMLNAALARRRVDPTLRAYAGAALRALGVLAAILLLLAVLGVPTAPFAALIAGATIAVALAWGRLLGDLAAGAFLILLPPFKVGDSVKITGEEELEIEGEVTEIGLFSTEFLTYANVALIVANSRISGAVIANGSARPYVLQDRRVPRGAARAAETLLACVAAVPGVLAHPAPQIVSGDGPGTRVRYACAEDAADAVGFAVNRAMAGLRRARPSGERLRIALN
jgi:small conductance mechanosensitive channel